LNLGGNVLVDALTRGGKGLLAISQLLTWPHSVVVLDIKGELYDATAAYRKTKGPVFVIDPEGFPGEFAKFCTVGQSESFL
jgi:type IV secretion system protein VirD4